MADTDSKTSEAGGSKAQPKMVPVVILVILIAVAVGVWFFIHRPPHAPPATAGKSAAAAGKTTQQAGQQAAPAASTSTPPPVQALTVDQLIQEAGTAFKEQRYVAPAGNNAVEYYLQVLGKDPKNQIAQDALREIFPFATGAVEQEINSGNLDEATREIDELTKVDPTNYTLTILRGKLDARKKQVENEQKLTAAAVAAKAAAKAAAEQSAQQPPVAPPSPPPAPKPVAPPPKPVVAEQKPPAPKGITRPAEILTSPSPHYPPEAYRRHVSGWVEVTFTVTAKGAVSNASVTAAEPNRLFNSAALEAVKRWTFKPRMQDGKSVPEKMTRRIEFKLGG